jgi:isoleucyl-tRNA synthetase
MSEQATKKSYKETLNLPKTEFPMEAKLVQNEPQRLARWKEANLYRQIQDARAGADKWVLHDGPLEARADAPRWILHDGPPFANADIHIGHVVNKTLKDVFVRYKSMAGFLCPYVPGWDCHGLPIEHKIQQDLGPKLREMSVLDVRKRCYAHAEKYARLQSEQFQRLGILGDWNRPYWTMTPEYEAATLEVFAEFVANGLVYKQLKPVHWSIENQTALADAELEYRDVDDPSVYVEFPLENSDLFKSKFGLNDRSPASYVIWTTTPWTLPANMAIAVHPEVEYALVKYRRNGKERLGVVAGPLVEKTLANREGVEAPQTLKTVKGQDLLDAGVRYRHPFMQRTAPLVAADYVTTTDGTGLVHTAGGHGEDDYATCMANNIDIYCPVLGRGQRGGFERRHNGPPPDPLPEYWEGE